jgi:hypothetical protein
MIIIFIYVLYTNTQVILTTIKQPFLAHMLVAAYIGTIRVRFARYMKYILPARISCVTFG